MTDQERLVLMKNRLQKLENSAKNIKCPGVVRKVRRQIRGLDK